MRTAAPAAQAGATTAAPSPGEQSASGTPGRITYSQDYWDQVLSQLGRRRLALIALLLLILMYSSAIYAPFLANDRPLYFKGIDLATYRKAQQEMPTAVSSLAERLGDITSKEERASIEQEVRSVRQRAGVMERQLSETNRRPLRELVEKVESAAKHALDGDASQASGEMAAATALAGRVASEMSPAATAAEAVPGQSVPLVPYRAFPASENLSRGDLFFMSLWAMVLTFPLWNHLVNTKLLRGNRFRVRHSRRSKGLAFVLLPLAIALLWAGEKGAFFVSPYKAGLTSGEVRAERVVFAPVPYGIAESNEGESFRPPTWRLESKIDDDGYYQYGPRAGRIDRATGLPKTAQPVVVEQGEKDRNHPLRHLLGTDSLGRDLLTRIIWGARVSLSVGLVSTVILVTIGTILGSLAGYYSGRVDLFISRVIEVVQTFPVFFLILIVVAFIGPSILNIMVVIGAVAWTGVARLVRGEFIRLRALDFVVASEALGVAPSRTIFRHILPNALGPVLVAATFGVASGILIESSLSFLGFGVQLPIPSWGSLLIESRSGEHWWIQVYPGLLVFLTVLLYNLFGEGVRDALDPRLKLTR